MQIPLAFQPTLAKMELLHIAIIVGVAIFSMLIMGMIIARLYRRASKEISFVRTGLGGQKVIMNGGALVLPLFQEVIPVNMNTLRLEVQRGNEAALITRDRMRVDVRAEFYVRVKPTADAIADAAQTLGRRTMNPTSLKELVEGKFVDALRAVAAGMTMEELHENRVDFVQKVQAAVMEDLLKNGLELEAVSLTALDQTDREFFNPNNAFDAQGLTKLTEQIEARRKQRNDIERDTEVQVQTKNLQTEKEGLEISRDEEYAKLMQQREVAVRRAAETTVTAQEEAQRFREAEQASISARQEVELSKISAERAVEEERISKERIIKERDIDRLRAIEQAEVERRKIVQLSEQDREIAIAEKSKSESEAKAIADKARALAIRAEEQVATAKATEIAEREKAIELVLAAKEAEREAIGIKVAADADKQAAVDRADAARTHATGEADKVRIVAEGDAVAEIRRAEAAAKRYAVDAEGKEAINAAENTLSPALIAMQIKLEVIRHLEGIIRESAKPMEQIDGIKIVQVEGLTGSGRSGGNGGDGEGGSGSGGGGNLAEQAVSAAMKYRTQAPMLDALLKEIGMTGGNMAGLTDSIKGEFVADDPEGDVKPETKPNKPNDA